MIVSFEYDHVSLKKETLPRTFRGPAPETAGSIGRGGEPLTRHYEIMIILEAGLDEDAIRQVIDRTTQLLTTNGATVAKVDRWGKRRFAYEVRHRSEGFYALVDTRAEPGAVKEVDRMLGLADEVIRHKVIRLPEKAVTVSSARSSGPEGDPPATNENGAR